MAEIDKVGHFSELDEQVVSRQRDTMNVEQIRKRLHEERKPFVIRLSDGRKFSIPHQDFIALGRHRVAVIDAEGYAVNIDPLRIVSLDDLKAKNRRK